MSEYVKDYGETLAGQTESINKVILWQYNDAAKMQQIILDKQAFNNENNFQMFYRWFFYYFNLRSADDNGMAVWAVILNLAIYFLDTISPGDYPAFGFITYGENYYGTPSPPAATPDAGSNFAQSGQGVSSLTTDERRLLLQLRYFQITTRGTVTEINWMLRYLFGEGAYVTDNLDMTMTYVFLIPISTNLQEYFANNDILPRPAGVGRNIAYGLTYSFGHAEYQEGFTSNFTHPADYVP